MTAGNIGNAPPSASTTTMRISPANIEQVDILARKLYKRARISPELDGIANSVRSLHTALKHLKFEADDPESLLNIDSSAVYARQLTPILEDSEFALKQLDTIFDKKYGRGDDSGSGDTVNNRGTQIDGDKGWSHLESRERDMIDLIHTKLTNQKLNIDMFLDTVQLHNSSKSRRMVDTNSTDLDSIKDEVDIIASRICQRTNSNLSEGNEEELWGRFRDELEQAGFSKEVLRKNQDVIRAYIRQLDNQLSANGGSTPSVRGLLEYYRPRADGGLQITPYPTYTPADFSPEELEPNVDEEKLFPSMRMKRLEEDEDDDININIKNSNIGRQTSTQPIMPDYPANLSYDRRPSGGGDNTDGSTALMSTREIMAYDKQSGMALATENMHLQPPPNPAGPSYQMSSPPTSHYLPPSVSQPALPSSAPPTTADQFGTHLHRAHPLPSAADSSLPIRRPHSVSVAEVNRQQPQQQQQTLVAPQQRTARLAPDSKGHEIPLDAKWTRIPRRLVSPEVLAGAGVRYEARPDFVAVLGELSRDEVAYFARRTTEVRAARGRRTSNTPVITGDGAKARKVEDRYHPDKYRNWDVIEEEERQRQRQRQHRKEGNRNSHDTDSNDDSDDDGVTYIVNSRSRRRRGSTASTVSALYDSSDDSRTSDETDSDERDRESYDSSSYSQSYPRSGSYLDDYHHSRSQSHRRSSTMPSTSLKYDDKSNSTAGADSKAAERRNSRDGNEKGTKTYPFIVSPPASTPGKDKGKDTGTGTSPAATVKPKPILKNKNDDPHVRIDPTPQIIEESSNSLPRSLPSYRRSERERERERDRERDRDQERSKDRDQERSKDRDRERNRDKEQDHDRDRDREKRYRSDKYTDGERERDRHTDRDRDRDRGDRTREKEYYSHRDREEGRTEYPHRHRHRSSRGHRYHSSSGPRKDREREYHDDHYVSSNNRSREDRTSKKKARDETIRAVGLGGAAAAMLSMLSEAAL
ncbi:uncharacterized protein F4812DRAFT_461977 [Daldinia caldariorum]|uniref:uncharacterized protein n=1 Tax=Daldinia caldariorum TaxID=326644 RepID=UPI002008AC05|nr:uncharacterized protein F4812DRAFT_461977 [Daldinia caldariorum]KAI1465134.1 hypothetical protein F4812DRAFT_461977 [Daldinia caldariorum]